jgi:tetratricopeptide (TPR) repeat protein
VRYSVGGRTIERIGAQGQERGHARTSLFVIYGASDDTFATRLIEALRAAGAVVVAHPLGAGDDGAVERIEEAIAECELVLLLLSPDALASTQVRQEMAVVIRRCEEGYIDRLSVLQTGEVELSEIPQEWNITIAYDDLAPPRRNDDGDAVHVEDSLIRRLVSAVPDTTLERAQRLVAEGYALARERKYPLAVRRFEEARQLDPEVRLDWEELATALNRIGRFAEAQVAAERALAERETDLGAWYEKGRALEGLERLDDALEAYTHAAVEDGNLFAEAWYAKARLLRRLGRDAEADEADATGESLEDAQDPDKIGL